MRVDVSNALSPNLFVCSLFISYQTGIPGAVSIFLWVHYFISRPSSLLTSFFVVCILQICTAKCTDNNPCPTDVPDGVTGKDLPFSEIRIRLLHYGFLYYVDFSFISLQHNQPALSRTRMAMNTASCYASPAQDYVPEKDHVVMLLASPSKDLEFAPTMLKLQIQLCTMDACLRVLANMPAYN